MSRARLEALGFWALPAAYVLAFDHYPYLVPALIAAIAFELFALVEIHKYGPSAQTRLLSVASGLAVLAAVVFMLPSLIERAFGDAVQSCWENCSDAGHEGKNLFGLYILLGCTGVVTALLAAFAWGGYVIQRLRSREPAPPLSQS